MEEGCRNIALLKTLLAIAPLSKRDVIQSIGEGGKDFDIIIDVLVGCIGMDGFLFQTETQLRNWYAKQLVSSSTTPLPDIKPYMAQMSDWGIAQLYAGSKEIVIVMKSILSPQQIEQLSSIFYPHKVEIEDAGKVIK